MKSNSIGPCELILGNTTWLLHVSAQWSILIWFELIGYVKTKPDAFFCLFHTCKNICLNTKKSNIGMMPLAPVSCNETSWWLCSILQSPTTVTT